MSVEYLAIDVEKRFADFTLCVNDQLSLDGVTAVFGPSGSGKSTLLRLLMGLVPPDRGTVRLGDEVLVDTSVRKSLPVHRRGLGLVFQDGRLLPHLSVERNLRFAVARARASNIHFTLAGVVEIFDLSALLARQPETLSGGERQRVALAQAILAQPRLLMLDEPLTGLDTDRKQDILPYLVRLKQSLAVPILYVSHDVREVAQLADRALILNGGSVVAHGPAVITLNAHGFGEKDSRRAGAIIEGRIDAIDQHLQLMKVALGDNHMTLPSRVNTNLGSRIRTIINADDVALSITQPHGISIQNILKGTIDSITAGGTGAIVSVEISLGDQNLYANITRASLETLGLALGMDIFALVKTATLLSSN